MSTGGYGGRKLSKNITVFTSDPENPQLVIAISGAVEAFADISPKRVSLTGPADKPIVRNVRIVPTEKYPFKILEAKAKIGTYIQYSLNLAGQSDHSEYVLTIENMRKESGRYYDAIYLKTDSKLKPEIVIGVYGNIQAGSG